jgi:dihydrofolate reductase
MTLLINGSITLLNYLDRHNLVDEYRLMVFPVLARAGKRLFGDQGPVRPLTLKHCQTTETGVAILTYAPAT